MGRLGLADALVQMLVGLMIVPIEPALHRQLVIAGAPVDAVDVPIGQLMQVALDVCAIEGLYVPDGQSGEGGPVRWVSTDASERDT